MKPGTLVLVGVGPRGLGQLTLETLEALKTCRVVLAAAHGPELEHLCRGLGVPCRALGWSGEARRGAGTLDTKDFAAAVRVELARGGRVAVAVDGNPALFSVADSLFALGPKPELHAAVSALDQTLAALRTRCGDLAARGVRAVNLETAGPRAALADPEAVTLLFNAGGLARREPRAAAALARRLSREAGAESRLWLVECLSPADTVLETAPARLAEDLRKVGVNVTLAVPPIGRLRPRSRFGSIV